MLRGIITTVGMFGHMRIYNIASTLHRVHVSKWSRCFLCANSQVYRLPNCCTNIKNKCLYFFTFFWPTLHTLEILYNENIFCSSFFLTFWGGISKNWRKNIYVISKKIFLLAINMLTIHTGTMYRENNNNNIFMFKAFCLEAITYRCKVSRILKILNVLLDFVESQKRFYK